MESCKTCRYWRKEYDDFRQDFNDEIIVDDADQSKHFCVMLDDGIPPEVFNGNADCPFWDKKE